ncbi:ROK family transcriptional regulator [Pacificibacter sp. AS14]|uniref:ROK family transcriptional regulator n=1 Tax=Pacificibacter sp. AS14 TaxID=3135785 RepID=UPI00317C3B16
MDIEDYEPDQLVADRFRRDRDNVVTQNERALLGEIWRNPGLPRSSLGASLELTQQSIHRLVAQLEARRLIQLGELCPPVYKGKPSPALHLNPLFGVSLGLSIDTDVAGLTLMRFDGSYDTSNIKIEDRSANKALNEIETAVDTLLANNNVKRTDIIGIGVAIAGFRIEGSRYSTPEPLSDWSSLQLAPFISDRFRLPVWTENGSNCSAVCELMLGVGRNVQNFVYLSFNYGLGAGVVLNSQLQTGGFGNAGEVSGMFTPQEMPHRPALKSLIEELRKDGLEVTMIEQLKDDFDPSLPSVQRWLDRVTPQHNRLINTLSAVIDPQSIVYGGQIPSALASSLIQRSVDFGETRHGVRRRRPEEVISRIEGNSAAIGAASLPLKHLFF